MNTAHCVSIRTLLLPALLCASAYAPQALGNESTISILRNAPLSLPRLASEADLLGHKPVRGDAFEVLGLSSGWHAPLKARGGATYLEIGPGVEWQQRLRNQRAGANYVSFTLNASIGSKIDIGGATLSIEPSQQDPSYAAIAASGTDRKIRHEVLLMLFGGARMATLDIVTVKVDRRSGTWDMWFRDSLVAADMPLADRQGASQISITAGKAGAWLCGLICSDENPLFEDANDNTVPDDFERKMLDSLLSQDASEQSRTTLRLAWREERRSRPPSLFVLTTPLPDSFPEVCAPEGEIVHGMTGGLKFGPAKKN